jgi:hypothetical protein
MAKVLFRTCQDIFSGDGEKPLFQASPDRLGGRKGDELIGDDSEKAPKIWLGPPERRQSGFSQDLLKSRFEGEQVVNCPFQVFRVRNDRHGPV